MLLEDLSWVREASTSLRKMPDPYHYPEPWPKKPRMCEVRERRGAADQSAGVLCACCVPLTSGGVATRRVHWSATNTEATGTTTRSDVQRLTNPARYAKSSAHRARALDHIANRAQTCRQAFRNGSIPWASEEDTARADELDRKEAAKLGSQGWAQLRESRGQWMTARRAGRNSCCVAGHHAWLVLSPVRRWLGYLIIHALFSTCCASGPLVSRTVLSLLTLDLCCLPRGVYRTTEWQCCFGARSVTLSFLARTMEMQWTYSGTGVLAAVWMLTQISLPAHISGSNVLSSGHVVSASLNAHSTYTSQWSMAKLLSPCAEGTSHVTEQESVSVDLLEYES